MRKYFQYFVTVLKVNTAYKADYFLSLILDAVFFFISFALWKAIFQEGNLQTIDTYSLRDTVTYFFITAILFRLDVSGSMYLGSMIWNGSFTNDLIKPWSVTVVTVMDALAEKFFTILMFIPVAILIFISARHYIIMPELPNLMMFIISVILAFFMMVTFNLVIHALTFRFGDQDANIELFNYIAIFLAGATFPLSFLPDRIFAVFNALPFKNIFFTPIQIFLGKMPADKVYQGWLETIIWTIIFYLIYKIVYQKGLKLYTGTGR